jgi:hypothetical protein
MAGVCQEWRMVEYANRRNDVWSVSGDVRIEGVCQEWKDGWSMPEMEGWWSMPVGGRMLGVCQEMSGWRECVRKGMDGWSKTRVEVWLEYAA